MNLSNFIEYRLTNCIIMNPNKSLLTDGNQIHNSGYKLQAAFTYFSYCGSIKLTRKLDFLTFHPQLHVNEQYSIYVG